MKQVIYKSGQSLCQALNCFSLEFGSFAAVSSCSLSRGGAVPSVSDTPLRVLLWFLPMRGLGLIICYSGSACWP